MNICDIPRNDIPAALAYLDESFDRNLLIPGEVYSILFMLQDDSASFHRALREHVAQRERQGKPVPRRSDSEPFP
jgi:hypothetical protein